MRGRCAMSDREEFSVWVFLSNEWHFPVEQWVDARRAVEIARRAVQTVELFPGRTDARRIIITDGEDFTVFEWQRGKGVTFPTPEGKAP